MPTIALFAADQQQSRPRSPFTSLLLSSHCPADVGGYVSSTTMVVIRQLNDNRVAVYSPRPCSQSAHSGDEGSQARERSKRLPIVSAGDLQDGGIIERLWETEGLSAVKKASMEKEQKRKRKILECATHGHSVVQLHNHLRHDGHFVPALQHMQKELDQGEQIAKLRHACCGDSVTREPNVGVTDGYGDLQQEYCGLQYLGRKEGARRRRHAAVGCQIEQAECFNSSFDLLTIEPRKLRTGFSREGCKSSKAVAAGVLSPCLSVDSMHSLCCSLSPSSPGTRLTNDKVVSLDDNIFCDTPTNIPPPKSSSGFPVKVTAPQYHESSGVTYEDADRLSPRQYGLYEMANIGFRASSHRVANQFRNLGICDEFPDSSTRPAARVVTAALKDAHQETLQKARNPETATRLDNMKASILCHDFFPRLVEAYISHRRVGASPEVKMRLRNLQAQLRDWRPPNITDFNANEAVNKFHSMIIAYEKDLETPFQKSMSFCYGLEKELELMESTTRAASAPICSLPQEHIRSELHDTNTFTRKRVWR